MDDNDGPREIAGGAAYLYVQVADAVEARIRRGEWEPGARLPGRGRMATRYQVAQMTIRRALRELEDRGLVRVLPSSGAYVMPGQKPGT